MTENELFVDNPLQIAGLYHPGLYIFTDRAKTKFSYTGQGAKGILHIMFYPKMEYISPKVLTILQKIMQAIKYQDANLTLEDYWAINAANSAKNLSLAEIKSDVNPHKIIIWTDTWTDEEPEIIFYKKQTVQNVDILRCHSIDTVVQDEERKKACWSAIREFFAE